MVHFINSEEYAPGKYGYQLGRLEDGANVCVYGPTRQAINTNFLNKQSIRSLKFRIDPQMHIYVHFGHFWKSFGGEQKSLKKEFWARFRTDSMKGALHDPVVKGLRPRMRFYYFTKDLSYHGIFAFEKSRLVYTIDNPTPDAAQILFGPLFNSITVSASSANRGAWQIDY